MTLIQILDALPPDTLLNDGATTWTAEHLADAIRGEEVDGRDYGIGRTTDGRTTIHRYDAHGYQMTPPAYVEPAPPLT